eukprot:scaffold3319_cov110-Isochrysis_galbana.AAC.3
MASPRGTPTKKARVEAPNIAYCVSLMRVHCADIARALEVDGFVEALRIIASQARLCNSTGTGSLENQTHLWSADLEKEKKRGHPGPLLVSLIFTSP